MVMCGAAVCEEVSRRQSADINSSEDRIKLLERAVARGQSPERPPLMSSIFDGSRQGTTWRLMPTCA